jgi:hypothetical protein
MQGICQKLASPMFQTNLEPVKKPPKNAYNQLRNTRAKPAGRGHVEFENRVFFSQSVPQMNAKPPIVKALNVMDH